MTSHNTGEKIRKSLGEAVNSTRFRKMKETGRKKRL
jgi:hypothetical protein